MSLGICTIISKNYISFARTLVNSFLQHHPNEKVFVLVTDELENTIQPANENFELIQLKDLNIPNVMTLCFKYGITELNTAVKPFFLEYLFNRYSINKLLYFDPDIFIFNSLNDVLNLLDKSSIVLTPHIVSPIKDDDLKPSEIDILIAGAYNLGFIGLSNSTETFQFLTWWQERLYKYCYIDIDNGLFVDQKWIDLVPGMFENTYILREMEYNVAYWNLHERKIKKKGQDFFVNGKPLCFYHFSGFDINLHEISKHQNRFLLKENLALYELFTLYKENLLLNDFYNSIEYRYTYDYFDNNTKIPQIIRTLYIDYNHHFSASDNPFSINPQNSFFNWLAEPVTTHPKIPRLLHEIYLSRPDLREAFPDGLKTNKNLLAKWGKVYLQKEYGIEKTLLQRLMY